MTDKNNIQSPPQGVSVLSLFDGMSCGMIALLNAGLKIKSYDAYEIDKYAIKTSRHNFPDIKQCGDVFDTDFAQYKDVDFLIGGSPCTYWSIAQTANRETEASGLGWELFSQYVRALHEAKPKYFIYENNKSMSRQIQTSIDKAFGFEAVCINSALVSAQNRQRLYWVGVRNADGTYRRVEVEQPEDKGMLLKDVLDDGITDRDKARTVMSSAERTTTREYFSHSQGNVKFIPVNTTTSKPIRVGKKSSKSGQNNRIYSIEGKSVALTASNTGSYIYPVEIDCLEHPTDTVYEVKNQYIAIKGKRYPIILSDGFYIIRKLSVEECKRLQTVPDWYDFSCVSDTRAYIMLGNGWTCNVITHLIRAVLLEGKEEI